jgi:uncharacterized Zn finger protein (UPF0148 family)
VKGAIVGAFKVESVFAREDGVSATVLFDANYTEVTKAKGTASEETFYARERWSLFRKAGVPSPAVEDFGKLTAFHCPNCGGAEELRDDGVCPSCGSNVAEGSVAWWVTEIQVLHREAKGPLLTQDVPEQGTDDPTVFQPDLSARKAEFLAANATYDHNRTINRFREVFLALQQAWTDQRWDRARAYETDNIFQTHRYWIQAYQRQGLRNVLEDIVVERIAPVKFDGDRFFDSMTVRIWARMKDYTVTAQGRKVCGSVSTPRRFSEYWTFIRRKGAKEGAQPSGNCPNCGAELNVSAAGACAYCGGKVTSGDFDWVLSRIEQDDDYTG